MRVRDVKELQKAELVVVGAALMTATGGPGSPGGVHAGEVVRHRRSEPLDAEFDTVLVVDFGAQYAQLIARRVREAHVYSEIVPAHDHRGRARGERAPAALILSGGPKSVHVDGAPAIDPAIYDAGRPDPGHLLRRPAHRPHLGGEVARTGRGEYGRTELDRHRRPAGVLLGRPARRQTVWMSHFDTITRAPEGFTRHRARPPAPRRRRSSRRAAASTASSSTPRSSHTPHGQELLKRFLYDAWPAPGRPGR